MSSLFAGVFQLWLQQAMASIYEDRHETALFGFFFVAALLLLE